MKATFALFVTLPLSVLSGSGTCEINGEGCNLLTAIACECVSAPYIQTCNTKAGTCAFGSCDGRCEFSPTFYGITIGIPLLLLALIIWCCCRCCCPSRDGGRRGMDERTVLLVAPPQPIMVAPPQPFTAPAPGQRSFCPTCGAAKVGKFCSACGAGPPPPS